MCKHILGTTGLLVLIAAVLLSFAPTLLFGPEPDYNLPLITQPVRRVAIVGGGISGLSLATILGRTGRHQVHVFERATHDRDEGYGLDFDWKGQRMLKWAGIYNKYWSFSRPYSDTFKVYILNSEQPLLVRYKPQLLARWFPSVLYPSPESNRVLFRAALLEEMTKKSVNLSYETTIVDVKRTPTGGAMIFDSAGTSYGEFDLVVDASGVHSSIRHLRVNDAQGKHVSNRVLIHGVINDPETSCPPEIVKRLGQGTYANIARGYFFVLQRFGADPKDHRTAFFYSVFRGENQTSIWSEIGVERQSNAYLDLQNLTKIKDWLHKDMKDVFHQDYHKVVDVVDRMTISPLFAHGNETTLKPHMDIPLVCIGDALRNIGLGGGGEHATEDVVDLSAILLYEKEKNIDFKPIRELEQESLERRRNHFSSMTLREDLLAKRPETKEESLDLSRGSTFWKVFLKTMSFVFSNLYALEQSVYGVTGSPPSF